MSNLTRKVFGLLQNDFYVKTASQIMMRQAHFTFKPDNPPSHLGKNYRQFLEFV